MNSYPHFQTKKCHGMVSHGQHQGTQNNHIHYEPRELGASRGLQETVFAPGLLATVYDIELGKLVMYWAYFTNKIYLDVSAQVVFVVMRIWGVPYTLRQTLFARQPPKTYGLVSQLEGLTLFS